MLGLCVLAVPLVLVLGNYHAVLSSIVSTPCLLVVVVVPLAREEVELGAQLLMRLGVTTLELVLVLPHGLQLLLQSHHLLLLLVYLLPVVLHLLLQLPVPQFQLLLPLRLQLPHLICILLLGKDDLDVFLHLLFLLQYHLAILIQLLDLFVLAFQAVLQLPDDVSQFLLLLYQLTVLLSPQYQLLLQFPVHILLLLYYVLLVLHHLSLPLDFLLQLADQRVKLHVFFRNLVHLLSDLRILSLLLCLLLGQLELQFLDLAKEVLFQLLLVLLEMLLQFRLEHLRLLIPFFLVELVVVDGVLLLE